MKFIISNAKLDKVTKEGENFGHEYVKLTVEEDSMMAEKEHTMVLFPTAAALAKWKSCIEKNEYPAIQAQYETVSYPEIPRYKLKGENANDIIYSQIKVLIPLDGDGKFRIAPSIQANNIISRIMEVVTTSVEPHVAEDVPAN